MDYQDQLAIGSTFNRAIERVLTEYGVPVGPYRSSAIAQAILVTLDQAGYKIVRK